MRRFTKISLNTLNHVVSLFLKNKHNCRITDVFKKTGYVVNPSQLCVHGLK